MSFLEILQKTKKRMYNICFVPARKSAHFLLGQPKPWFNFAVVVLAEWGRHSQSSSRPQGCGMLLHPQDGLGGPAADLYFQQCRIPTQRQLMTSDKRPWPPFPFTFFSLPIPGAILGVELNSCIVPVLESSRKKYFKFWGSSIFFTRKSVNFKSGFISVHCRHSRNLWFI